jgi:uncharacterized protein (DUF433 family)
MIPRPEIKSGAPLFLGTLKQIQTIFDFIEGGKDLAYFLDDFPSVSKEYALAVLEMVKKSKINRYQGIIPNFYSKAKREITF